MYTHSSNFSNVVKNHANDLNSVNGQNKTFRLLPHSYIDFLHQHSPKDYYEEHES